MSRLVIAHQLLEKGFGTRREAPAAGKPRIFVMGFPGQKLEPQLDDFNWETKPYSAIPVQMNTVVANEALMTYLSAAFKAW